jgi:hypothetical protein
VEHVLESVAAADPQLRVVDTHPLPPSDPVGLDIFYLVIAATILGFLTVFQVRTNAGGLSLRGWTVFVLSLCAGGIARPRARRGAGPAPPPPARRAGGLGGGVARRDARPLRPAPGESRHP